MKKQEENIAAIAERIRGLRDIVGISAAEMAKALDISEQEYLEYEKGQTDFSFSFLYTVANELGLNITDLIIGESAKLDIYSYVPAGEGIVLERKQEYEYRHLAYLFKDKKIEPFYVTVEPSDIYAATNKKTHAGHEFNYILEGCMTLFIGEESIYLSEGDAIYFNSIYPHAMQAENGKPCKFLAVIAK